MNQPTNQKKPNSNKTNPNRNAASLACRQPIYSELAQLELPGNWGQPVVQLSPICPVFTPEKF